MLLHANCVAIGEMALLITGASQTGKTSLSLELMRSGALLIADDQTQLFAQNGTLFASAPKAIAGLIEVTGVGVLRAPQTVSPPCPIAFEVHLTNDTPERMPEKTTLSRYETVAIARYHLHAKDASNAAKTLFLTQVFQQAGGIYTTDIAKPESEG